MARGMLTKILRAALLKPWEYSGPGAPNDWEVRIDDPEDPDEATTVAIFSPYTGQWTFFQKVEILFTDQSLDDVDRHTANWVRLIRDGDDEDD